MIRRISNKIVKKINEKRPIKLEYNYISQTQEFSGKKALIIGGGTGIGFAIADELLKSGADITILGRKKHNIDNMKSVAIDVSDIENLEHNLEKLDKEYGNFDIIVNAQGICPEPDFLQKFNDIDQLDFENVMRTNCESVFFVCQHYISYYLKNDKEGNILNICSTEGLKGCVVPYGISKAAVISLTKGLGKRYAAENIIINGIAPGATATQMMGMQSDGDLRKDYIPSKRASVPQEIAKTARLLLSDTGRQMCGQIVTVDGGESLH